MIEPTGKILAGDADAIRRGAEAFCALPVDLESDTGRENFYDPWQRTIAEPFSVAGPGTFFGPAQRVLHFEPGAPHSGWWLDRTDLHDAMPIKVSIFNVWTTGAPISNIVLCSGSPHNYMRMVEHIVSARVGLGIDNVTVRMDSGDPPLFDRGSMDLVQALETAGTVTQDFEPRYVTVTEPVTIGKSNGAFLTLLPCEDDPPSLHLDVAIDFPNAIGRQRIRCYVDAPTFRAAAAARTNAPVGMVVYCKTIGKLFADLRNLGYSWHNVLIAGRRRYLNEPRLRLDHGKSLEAAWHRAMLDLLGALALIDRGRFAGRIVSYKSGHALDVQMIRHLYRENYLRQI